MAQKRILKRDASTGRVSEGVSTDTYFSADPSVSSDLATKNYIDNTTTTVEQFAVAMAIALG